MDKLVVDGKLSSAKLVKPKEDKVLSLGAGLKVASSSILTLWSSLISKIEVAFEVYKASGVMTATQKATIVSSVEDDMGVLIAETVTNETLSELLTNLVDIICPVLVDWFVAWLVGKGVITYDSETETA